MAQAEAISRTWVGSSTSRLTGHKVSGKFAYDNVRQVLGGDVRVKIDGDPAHPAGG